MLNFIKKSPNLVFMLQKKSLLSPHAVAYRFLSDGTSETETITYRELDKKARIIAAYLQRNELFGERILLVYSAGIDFITAFIGCLYAGAIAVPVQAPTEGQHEKILESIISLANNAEIKGIFTTGTTIQTLKNHFSNLIFISDIRALDKDALVMYQKPKLNDETICYLQYTSGSTSTPKAAVVRHKNLTHSLKSTIEVWHYNKKSITLTWAPHTHVYGLICGLLVPLYHGTVAIIMSTRSFVLNPYSWLKAISDYKVSHSGCPNFGYDLCVKEINDTQIKSLDLSCWKVAINGGDQVQLETLFAFTKKFSPCGFSLKSFNSAYGMSEVTGAIAVGLYQKNPRFYALSAKSLNNHVAKLATSSERMRNIVSSGLLLPGLDVKIVNPENLSEVNNGKIGEVWLTGASVVSEYWKRPEESNEIFNRALVGSKKLFFRTGDLGFIRKKELFLTGRLKDVIVVHGKKYYPADLEQVITKAVETYQISNNKICFSVTIDNEDQVVCLQEIPDNIPLDIQDNIVDSIKRTIVNSFGIHLYHVELIKENSIPKTGSGKIQRKKCQAQYLETKIDKTQSTSKGKTIPVQEEVKSNSFETDFKLVIANVLNIDANEIDLNATVSSYHFDSISIIKLAGVFNEKFKLTITPADLFSYSTLSEFYHSIISNHESDINTFYKKPTDDIAANDIAIIGMSGIFPGAKNVDEFWDNLIQGKDAITQVPPNRWDADHGSAISWGGFIEDIDKFDAEFFNISAYEAELMDPQHRILLQTVCKTIEDAGYSTQDIASCNTGLYVGLFNHDYAELLQQNDIIDAYTTTGIAPSILANRISYLLNLKGPSEVIDTACSSSLVAIHHAIQAIRNGDCELAIAGGVNALLTPTSFISATKAGMLSVDGRCKTFSAEANGFVRSEGVAAILLKPLALAITDNNFIYGVIKGSAVNHGGHANSLTAPNPSAQADVIVAACKRANISVDTIQYIEAHGTGTPLGDPVEINGLKKAFSILQDIQAKNHRGLKLPHHYCGIGSVKTHVGHLESAAGITGIIKVLLSMQHNTLPANLHFTTLNPYIDLLDSPFYILNENKNWIRTSEDMPRRAGVSSFGFGGTNAHVILEDFQNRVGQQKNSLPGYPFAKNSYWFTKKEIKHTTRLHKLIDANISTLDCEKFSKTFSGNENYILDHKIQHQTILPGVVYIEMARAAAELALPDRQSIAIKNLIWSRPLFMNHAEKTVAIDLVNDEQKIHFSIKDESVLYAQGELVYTESISESIKLDLNDILDRCHEKKSAQHFYEKFKSIGIDYGNSFKCIAEVCHNTHEVIALIVRSESDEDYVLHPSSMDAALQSVFCLIDSTDNLYMPYSIGHVKIFNKLPKVCYVYGVKIDNSEHLEFDIQITDENGMALVSINNFSLRLFADKKSQDKNTLAYYTSRWIPEDILLADASGISWENNEDIIFLSNEIESSIQFEINNLPKIIIYTLNQRDSVSAYHNVFKLTQAILLAKPQRVVKIMCLYQDDSAYIEALSGFSKSLHLENPYLTLRVIKISDRETLFKELNTDDISLRYENGKRLVKRYELIQNDKETIPSLRQSGVYLITGGLGGLGLIFANYLVEKYQAKVILVGRSALSLLQAESIKKIGEHVIYLQADVTDMTAMQAVIAQSQKQLGKINGVIHSAGVLRDSYLIKKTETESAAVLAPKVLGTSTLDELTKEIQLDFFVTFSSAASIFGNIGQCDYAYANAYMDAFIEEREKKVLTGMRFGKSTSINWPLWIEGGISITSETQNWLYETLGVSALTMEQGLAAFEFALSTNHTQIIVLPGNQDKLKHALSHQAVKQAMVTKHDSFTLSHDLEEQTQAYFKQIISAATKLPVSKIKSNEAFENYGIDSVMIVGLNQKIAALFGNVPKTLFFECKNLAELSEYFIKHYAGKLAEIVYSTGSSIPAKLKMSEPRASASVTKLSDSVTDFSTNLIAIIGLSGRYPEAEDIAAFWENLKAGKDCITTLPADRWHHDENKNIWGGFLADVDKFDPLFFNISPREAESMDPQERLFLETTYKTIEDAGYARESLASKKVGVFVGVMYGQYQLWGQAALAEGKEATANSVFASIANRVSYYFDFHGPSMALDTMCSSSLTAIHLACNSIRDGESEYAIAGGVNLNLHPNKYHLLTQGKFLSSDGRCRSFGEGGDGYVPGEGVGAVLLKSYTQAIADGDHIYAVIKGSSLNHGGKTNGYTVPNPIAQADVIENAYKVSNVDPASISYIEAHGTGTALGDPIEISALNKVFANNRSSADVARTKAYNAESAGSTLFIPGLAALSPGYKKNNIEHLQIVKEDSCAIGSVKSNIGHCESAAGMAALTKVLLQLKYKKLVPSLHADKLNENVDWENTGFKVQRELAEWTSHTGLCRAGISSFGAGGSNAHLILEEAPQTVNEVAESKPYYLLTLSAKTDTALSKRINDLLNCLADDDKINLLDLSYTLNHGRTHFGKRCAMVVANVDDLRLTLQSLTESIIPENACINTHATDKSSSVSVFTKIFTQLIAELSQDSSAESYKANLFAVANFYVDGYELDWTKLYNQENYHKISLPTYPFSKERYWIASDEMTVEETNHDGLSQLEQIQSVFINFISNTLKIKSDAISLTTSLTELGFDSITFKELTTHLENYYHIDLLPTVFFTHNTIQELSLYLLNNQTQKTSIKKTVIQETVADDIAIIGMQAYLPGSDDLQTFWNHLIAGDDLVTEVPSERWDWHHNYGDAKKDSTKSNSKWGGFLSSVDQFDASFFNLSAREANLMDPQHRLFLEVVWQTLEDAGYNPLTISKESVGLFAGVEFSEYHTLISKADKDFHGFVATGNSHSMLTNRVSYFLNLKGPSEAVDTACSSSLVAIHRAVNAIKQGECQLAIAGGVSLILDPDTYVITSQLGALSPDGRCKTFDKSANGYVKGEGVGAVLLKPLSKALADGDHVYGVIKATGVNHGGKGQSLTAPSVTAQSELLMHVYAHLNPSSINYIETHGTGTELGDPIEIEALKIAFKHSNNKIALGALKSNIGHLEPASGIASVIKVLLALRYKKIPSNLHCHEINPYINLNDTPFHLVNQAERWDALINEKGEALPRRAGISSFGFGGTNAHIVIEEAAINTHQSTTKSHYLITLSAKHNNSLQHKINNLVKWLDINTDVKLADLSYTLNACHAHFAVRCAFVIESIQDLKNKLASKNTVFSVVKDEPAYRQSISSTQDYNSLVELADIYCKQYTLDWDDFYKNEKFEKIALLPAYPFNRQRYWFDADTKVSPVKIEVTTSNMNDFALSYLQAIFAEKLQLPKDEIEFHETYEVYGVDSVMGLDITQRLENDFGDLPKTLLYERNNLTQLAKFFCDKYKNVLVSLSGIDADNNQVTQKNMISTVARSSDPTAYTSTDIAIIGISGTYPNAKNIFELWENLQSGQDSVGEVPPERWNYLDYPVTVGGETKYFNKGGFIPDVDKFDPLFFGIAPSDAVMMDPQERLFLQSAWTTLEDAGYTRESLQRTVNNHVGVFVGVTYNFYPLFIAEEWNKGNRIPLDIQLFSVANRVSYFLNATGPSFVIDTACSSSLAAIHQACESIISGECTMALAGGVNLSLHPAKYHMLGSLSFLSDEGRCASFGEGGSGYVPAEGVGSILLKPLSLALRDNDRIYAVIKASSMNHGGKTSGYTVPNPGAQAEVIKSALHKANIDARTISYVEAHGTGTSLGDPIEVRGLQDAYSDYTQDKQYCALGSIKSNIGHPESAAGIAQITKVILQLQHKKIAASLHSTKLNPFIDFADTAFYVPQTLSDWNTQDAIPRRAGVSSFGAGGANVHVIVEEYVTKPASEKKQVSYLFLLSAMNQDRLKDYVRDVYEFVRDKKDNIDLASLCYTSQVCREAMTSRLAIVFNTFDELLEKLNNFDQTYFNPAAKISRKFEDISGLDINNDREKLAALWCQGAKINWEIFYNNVSRCYLPTYPFAKRRCWVGNQEPAVVKDKTKKWLIFSDFELGSHLQTYFGNDNCINVFVGDVYSEFSKNSVYLNPDNLDDYTKLFQARSDEIEGIIYLWTLLPEQDLGLINKRFLYLFQALVQRKPLQLCLVNRSEENSEILQHHLWNLKQSFSHKVQIINLYDDKSLVNEAKCIQQDIKVYNLNINQVTYSAMQRNAVELVNPPRFIEEQVTNSEKKITTFEVLDREHVSSLVLNALAQLLAMDVIEIDPEVPFLNYGMDSIIGINFVAEINKSFPELLSPMDLYRYPAVSELVSYIIKSCEPEQPQEIEVLPVLKSEEEFLAEIGHLDDAEVSRLIEAELKELDDLLG
ncbi:MAG: SDR family NAD(P)-dependent oxidoreductase [Gammaproteobacteria bacterium]|nr:SDR family NAD(P)-dependent oxidoreductase [Gammaproteobacteria bacterium]